MINLENYEKTGKCRGKEDAACLAKYPDAYAIIPLIRVRKLSLKEWIIDTIVQPNILFVVRANLFYLIFEIENYVNIKKIILLKRSLVYHCYTNRIEWGIIFSKARLRLCRRKNRSGILYKESRSD